MSITGTQTTLAEELAAIFTSIKRTGAVASASLKGMRRSHFLLLMTVRRITDAGGGEPTVSALSEELGITPAAITHLVNSLEAQGHLVREADPSDRRKVVLRVTEPGQRFIDEISASALARLSRLVEYLGEADSRELIRLLRVSAEFFSHEAEKS